MTTTELINEVIEYVINNPIIISIDSLLDRYEVTKTLSIVSEGDNYFYQVRYNGSPVSSENEKILSREYPTAALAASAAIKKFNIINIRYGCAVLAPTKVNPPIHSCRDCEWYSQETNWCAVNPLNLGKTECPDFSLPSMPPRNTPKPIIRLGLLGEALVKCGLVK